MQSKRESQRSKMDWTPHPYQERAIEFMLKNPVAGLFLDPGLGKTSITLATLKVLKHTKMFDKALVVAPLRVCYSVWPREVEKWNDFKELKTVILHGKEKEKRLEEDADLYIINPEGLSWLFNHRHFKRFGFDVLIIDESSKFKSTKTKRFKSIKHRLSSFNRRYILTGTPVPNGYIDLFGQIYILDMGRALGRYITHYRNSYFRQTGFGGYVWTLQENAAVAIRQRIDPITLRLESRDYLELPQRIENNIYVELSDKAVKIYKEMQSEFFAFLQGKFLTAVSAAVASGKCRQIANGGVYDEDSKAHHLGMWKAEATKDLVDELQGTPCLIAYEFNHDLDRLRKVFGKAVPFIGGGVSAKKSSIIADKWNAGEIPVLIGHPASMAHGLNLQNAGNHVIWHSLPWNLEWYDQFNQRVLRQGSKHSKVFIHHIIAEHTIDEVILSVLKSKDKTQKSLLDGLKKIAAKESANFSLYFDDKLDYTENMTKKLDKSINIKERKMSKFTSKIKRRRATKSSEQEVEPKVIKKVTKKVTKKVAKKVTKKVTKKTKVEKSTSVGKKTRIKKLVKNPTCREGTVRYALMAAILGSKSVIKVIGTEVVAANGKTVKVAERDVLFAIQNGYISLY